MPYMKQSQTMIFGVPVGGEVGGQKLHIMTYVKKH